MLIASTYAWFTTQKNVSIENLRGTVEVAEGLEISLDAKTWGQKIDLSSTSILDNAYTEHKNIYPTELLPASTVGEIATNDAESDRLAFIRGTIDSTADTIGFKDGKLVNELEDKYIQKTKESLTTLYGKPDWDTETEGSQAGKDIAYDNLDYPAFYAFDVFLRNTSRGGSGDAKDNLQLNKDSSAWVLNSEWGNDAGSSRRQGKSDSGLQNCIRVGFLLYKNTAEPTDDASNVINSTVTTKNTKDQIAIWEPNANAHVDYIVNSNNKLKTDEDNASLNESTTPFKKDGQFFTFGIKQSAAGQTLTNIYDWTSEATDSQYLEKQKTLQTPANDAGQGALDKIYDIKDIAETNFGLSQNKVSRVRVYVWLEGQDVDCVNYASFGGGIELDIGLIKGATADGVVASPTAGTE